MTTFETAATLKAEREIADFMMQRFPQHYDAYIKLSEFNYRLDFAFYKADPNGLRKPRVFCEAKQRSEPFRHYPTYWISAGKLVAAQGLRHVAPSILVVRFSDGIIAAAKMHEHDGKSFEIAGRPPRPGAKSDIEPVAVFYWDQFKVLLDPRGV